MQAVDILMQTINISVSKHFKHEAPPQREKRTTRHLYFFKRKPALVRNSNCFGKYLYFALFIHSSDFYPTFQPRSPRGSSGQFLQMHKRLPSQNYFTDFQRIRVGRDPKGDVVQPPALQQSQLKHPWQVAI